jgi:ankyrin repeat protein
MATLCHERAAELAALPVPVAVRLLRNGVEATTRALAASGPPASENAAATLRHLLACPSLRELTIKFSRLTSLAVLTIEIASKALNATRADAAAAAVLRLLWDASVNVTSLGTVDWCGGTPLLRALLHHCLDAAQVLLDVGADVNEVCSQGDYWPLYIAALVGSDAAMTWLLDRGASLTRVNGNGRTIVHQLAAECRAKSVKVIATSGVFHSHSLRRIVGAEPGLLEARNSAGSTPLLSAADAGSDACVATLLELGADAGSFNAHDDTALSLACRALSLPVVRRIVAAGDWKTLGQAPGSPQAQTAIVRAVDCALAVEQRCGRCAARCSAGGPGNCADGLDMLRAVLAAGVREPVTADKYSTTWQVVYYLRNEAAAKRISASHALETLQMLAAGGVDVLARGSADLHSILHLTAVANAPEIVRWLVTVAGASLEGRDSSTGNTPLSLTCWHEAWAAAHTLLDCGARADVQGTDEQGAWPVLWVLWKPAFDETLFRRLLSADRSSLLRCTASEGEGALHIAAADGLTALMILLNSGLPHMDEAINAVMCTPARDGPERLRFTPLHCALRNRQWSAALAWLAAGARVDIARRSR